MTNYRVENLEGLVEQLMKEGVTFVDSIEASDYGKFVHILRPEGNKVEVVDILKAYDTGAEHLFKEMDGRLTGSIRSRSLVLASMLAFYDRMDDAANYTQTLDLYISKMWNDEGELNNFAWGIYEHAKPAEIEKVEAATKCSIRSIELKKNYANNDTYAWLLYKADKKQEALAQAEKAIEIGKANNEDCSETQKLVRRIKGTE